MMTSPQAPPSGDLNVLKRLNRAAVVDAIRREPGLSRADVAMRAGLTKATVGAVVQDLLERGWLTEGGLQQGGGGRPGRALHLDEERHVLFGAEVGVGGLRLVACTLSGAALKVHQHPLRPTTPEATAAQLAAQLADLRRHPAVAGRTPLGVGLALPGPVHPYHHRLLSAPNIGWRDVPFLDLLRRELPSLGGQWWLDNEAKAAAFGELYFYGGAVPESLAYISAGSGIGSGLASGGHRPLLLRGAHGLGGEIGHTVLQPGGLYCHCGNRGCAETLVSGWAIRAALSVPEGSDLSEAVRARSHDRAVHVTLQRAGEALGTLLLNLHHTFNPAEIVIGGSLTRLGDALLAPALTFFGAHQSRLLGAAPQVRVRVLQDSTFVPARGAAAQTLAQVVQGTGGHV